MPVKKIPQKPGGRTQYAQLEVINPGKGLNVLISDNLIDDHESSALTNIQFIESGAPAKAYGYTNVGTGLTNNPRGLGFFNDTITGNRDLLTVDGINLMYNNAGTWTSVGGATFDPAGQINFTQVKGSMYVLDGVNAIAQLASGRTLSRNGHAPRGSFSIFYGGRHITAGVDGQENRLYIAKTSDASEFTVTTGGTQPQPDNSNDPDSGVPNVPGATAFSGDTPGNANAVVVDVSKLDGDKITALGKFQNHLIIFKERAIYQFDFDASGVPTIALLTSSYGCVSHRSIDSVENDLFFLTRNGIYVLGNEPNFNAAIRTNELSTRIHPLIETINPANFQDCSALFNNYVYYIGVPSGGVTNNNMTITYDRRFQAWSPLTHIMPEAFCLYTDTDNVDTVYFTSANSPNVYAFTQNYDADGDSIPASWSSKSYDLGNFNVYKRWVDLTILFRQLVGTVTIQVFTDNGDLAKTITVGSSSTGGMGTNLLGGGDWLGGTIQDESGNSTITSTTNVPYRVRLSIKSRTIKIVVSNDRVNETFVVLGFAVRYRPYSPFSWPSSLKITG